MPSKSSRTIIKRWLFVAAVLALVAVLALAIHVSMAKNTVGTDILVFYLAAKSSFIDGQGPYSTENPALGQLLSTGKLAQAGDDYLYFSYPPYALIPLLPLVHLPFDWVQAVWLAILIVALFLVLSIFCQKGQSWIPATAMFIYPITFGLLMGNFVVPIAIILLANIKFLFFNDRNLPKEIEITLAIFLAWATVKPQFSWIYISFILLFAIRQKRHTFLLSFAAALLGFLAVSFLIWPDWIPGWVQQINLYRATNPTEIHLISFLNGFLPQNIANFLTIPLIGIGLFWIGYTFYQWWHKKFDTLMVFIVIGWMSHLLYPGGVAYQQIVFVLPFILWLMLRTKPKQMVSILLWVAAILIGWMEFVLGRLMGTPVIFGGWLFAAYLVWFIIVLIRSPKPMVQPLNSIP
jgi:hypothetical protein